MPQQPADHPSIRQPAIRALAVSGVNAAMTIACAGDLADDAATLLRETAAALIRDGARSLTIDTSAVDFIDCAGVGALVGIRTQALLAGAELHLASPAPLVIRILQLAHLDAAFGVTGKAAVRGSVTEGTGQGEPGNYVRGGQGLREYLTARGRR